MCFSRRFYPLSKLRSIVYDLPSLESYSPFEGFLLQVEYSHLAAFSHPRGITIYGCFGLYGLNSTFGISSPSVRIFPPEVSTLERNPYVGSLQHRYISHQDQDSLIIYIMNGIVASADVDFWA